MAEGASAGALHDPAEIQAFLDECSARALRDMCERVVSEWQENKSRIDQYLSSFDEQKRLLTSRCRHFGTLPSKHHTPHLIRIVRPLANTICATGKVLSST